LLLFTDIFPVTVLVPFVAIDCVKAVAISLITALYLAASIRVVGTAGNAVPTGVKIPAERGIVIAPAIC
jgi:hypothetical protein